LATQLNAHKVSGSGFNVQHCLWPQASSLILEYICILVLVFWYLAFFKAGGQALKFEI